MIVVLYLACVLTSLIQGGYKSQHHHNIVLSEEHMYRFQIMDGLKIQLHHIDHT